MLLIYMSFIDDESHRRLFEEIYLSYRKQMFLVARTVLKNDSDAEDIVHDVFLRIAKKYMAKISTIENETDLRNYLLKATKNAATIWTMKVHNSNSNKGLTACPCIKHGQSGFLLLMNVTSLRFPFCA